MLETIVSSRIRRTLFEYILSHPQDRFYLRGLAKELNLSVSPLRRELKRLEHSGLLRADQEGNILFYTTNTASPIFAQLKQAGRPAEAPSPVLRVSDTGGAPVSDTDRPHREDIAWRAVVGHGETPVARAASALTEAIQMGVLSAEQPPVPASAPVQVRRSAFHGFWRSPLSQPALIGAAGVGMALLLIVAVLLYVSLTNHQLAKQASRVLATRKTEVTVVVPQTSASGTMRGSRWQIVPGGFGGFSSSSNSESY